MDTLILVSCQRFTAGIVFRKGRAIRAAPILRRWIGRKLEDFLEAAKRMNWELT